MQLIANDLVLEEESMTEIQPTADNLLQHGEDHLELHPTQPRLDNIKVQNEDLLIEAPPMELMANDSPLQEEKAMSEEPLLQPTPDSLSQHSEDHLDLLQPIPDDIQRRDDKEPLLATSSVQPIADDSPILDDKAKDEAPLLQPIANDQSSLHQDDQLRQDEQEIASHSPQLMVEVEANVYTLQELVRLLGLCVIYYGKFHCTSCSDEAAAFGGASDSYDSLEGSPNLG